jgi:hypothetical protein
VAIIIILLIIIINIGDDDDAAPGATPAGIQPPLKILSLYRPRSSVSFIPPRQSSRAES